MKRFKRGQHIKVEYLDQVANQKRTKQMRVREVQQGRSGKVMVEGDEGALVGEPGGRPDVFERNNGKLKRAGSVINVEHDFRGRINEVQDVIDGKSMSALEAQADVNGVKVPQNATRRDIGELLIATGAAGDRVGPPKHSEAPDKAANMAMFDRQEFRPEDQPSERSKFLRF